MHKHKLSLEILSVNEVSSPEAVRIAAASGYDYVSLFINSPAPTVPPPKLLDDVGMQREVAAEMKNSGVRMLNIECFNLAPGVEIKSYRRALEVGSKLGATNATVIVWENDDEADVARRFKELCFLASEYGVTINIEFMALSRSMPSLECALALIQRSEAPNGALTLDLLHLMRTGGTVEQVKALDPKLVGHVQLCDGPLKAPKDQLHEAGAERMVPGEGEFPIAEFLAALPDDAIVGVEVAQKALAESGVSAMERAMRLKSATENYWN